MLVSGEVIAFELLAVDGNFRQACSWARMDWDELTNGKNVPAGRKDGIDGERVADAKEEK